MATVRTCAHSQNAIVRFYKVHVVHESYPLTTDRAISLKLPVAISARKSEPKQTINM